VIALRQRRRNRVAGVWTAGDTFLLLGAIVFIGLPFIPSQLNGLYYFADRLVICVWLGFLLAACGGGIRMGEDVLTHGTGEDQRPSRVSATALPVSYRTACILFALITNAALLFGANRLLRPVARSIAALDHVSLPAKGELGFLLEDPRLPLGERHGAGPSWNPYYWATIHLFRHNDAVLINAPWMNETILPVAPSAALPEVSIESLQEPLPTLLQGRLLASPQDLRATLSAASFFVVNKYDRAPLQGTEPLLQSAFAASQGWSCTNTPGQWYRICERPSTRR
jgi:hypothetical protein